MNNIEEIQEAINLGTPLETILQSIRNNKSLFENQASIELVVGHVRNEAPKKDGSGTHPDEFIEEYIRPLLLVVEWYSKEELHSLLEFSIVQLSKWGCGHQVLDLIRPKYSQFDSLEIRSAIAKGLREFDTEEYSFELSYMIQSIGNIPEITNDSTISDAMKIHIPHLVEKLQGYNQDHFIETFETLEHIQNIDILMESRLVQSTIDSIAKSAISILWEREFPRELVGILSIIPILISRPDIRVAAAYLANFFRKFDYDVVRNVPEWMSKAIILSAIGENERIDSIPDSEINIEIEEYCMLLEKTDEPWQVIDVIKEIPKIWNDQRIREAVERSVPRIAKGFGEIRYPLDILKALLQRSAMRYTYTEPAWVFKHDELDRAIRESADRLLKDLINQYDAPRLAFKLALWDAGVGKVEVEIPKLIGPRDHSGLDRLSGIVDIKGWEYVYAKIDEQIKIDPSYAEILVKQMPTKFDYYFDERMNFPSEFGFKLVKLLFPYKPLGYISAMKIVYEIATTTKGQEWMWDEYKDELYWIEIEAGLYPE